MFKKNLLAVFIVMMSIFVFSISYATQIDGMHSGGLDANGNTETLPAGLHVSVNPGGLGNALIYGYYNARNDLNLLRVINTSTSSGVGAKIRFREGRNSNEVLDFFICLSAADQWTGWIFGDNNTATPASFIWYDTDTPTFPDPQGDDDVTNNLLASKAFFWSGTGGKSIISADDTKEGYVEILGIRSWTDIPGTTPENRVVRTPQACAAVLGLGNGETASAAYGGGSFSVGAISNGQATIAYGPANAQKTATLYTTVPNSLAGNLQTFNLSSGKGTFAYNAIALKDCIPQGLAPSIGTEGAPLLEQCDGGIAAVDYVLTKAHQYVIYDVDSTFTGNTDLINTFPTRRASINGQWLGINSNPPFLVATAGDPIAVDHLCRVDSTTGEVCATSAPNDASPCSTKNKLGPCCAAVSITPYDDAENTLASVTGFSGSTTVTKGKCWDVNYLVVGSTAKPLLPTSLESFAVDVSSFQRGILVEDMTPGGYYTALPNAANQPAYQAVFGLPVISYELGGFVNEFFSYMLPLRYDVHHLCTDGTGTGVTCPTGP